MRARQTAESFLDGAGISGVQPVPPPSSRRFFPFSMITKGLLASFRKLSCSGSLLAEIPSRVVYGRPRSPFGSTRFGKPVAAVMPPSPDTGQSEWIGSTKDTMHFVAWLFGYDSSS